MATLPMPRATTTQTSHPAWWRQAIPKNMDGAETTQLYVFDAEANVFALQDPPNDGVLNTIATVDVEIVDETSFDIAPSGEAYASIPRLVATEATPVSTPGATPVT